MAFVSTPCARSKSSGRYSFKETCLVSWPVSVWVSGTFVIMFRMCVPSSGLHIRRLRLVLVEFIDLVSILIYLFIFLFLSLSLSRFILCNSPFVCLVCFFIVSLFHCFFLFLLHIRFFLQLYVLSVLVLLCLTLSLIIIRSISPSSFLSSSSSSSSTTIEVLSLPVSRKLSSTSSLAFIVNF